MDILFGHLCTACFSFHNNKKNQQKINRLNKEMQENIPNSGEHLKTTITRNLFELLFGNETITIEVKQSERCVCNCVLRIFLWNSPEDIT